MLKFLAGGVTSVALLVLYADKLHVVLHGLSSRLDDVAKSLEKMDEET